MDTQKHLLLASTLEGRNESLLSTLQKINSTFDLRDDQRYTAVNPSGFEVLVIRPWQKTATPIRCKPPRRSAISGWYR